MELAGKTAIITGGGKGLGRAITRVLAERGVSVVTIGRNRSNLEAVREEIRAKGGTIEIVQGDVGSRHDVQRTVERAVTRFNGIDILVNNAQALEFDQPVLDVTDENLEVPFRRGLLGTLYCMQACYPYLKARGGGSIVNFGSATAIDGRAGFASYVITKEAIRGLTRIAAKEWGPDNIRVNVVCPAGLTEATQNFAARNPDPFEAAVQLMPMRRVGDPVRDIGHFVAALVNDDAQYLMGATLMLDGGQRIIN